MNILLTGATGFVGSHLVEFLTDSSDVELTCVVRRPDVSFLGCTAVVETLDAATDLTSVLSGQKVVIHAAARAHIMKDEEADPLKEYRRVNVDGTLNLARQAAEVGVKRFIFISSIKVNGEQTPLGQPFTADSVPAPEDSYGLSKWEAEQGLQKLAAETEMEVVIIRPPLVYGPGVKGNLASMIKLIAKGFPLPLDAIRNKRSLVGVDNLVDLIIACIEHPAAANQIFLAGDGCDLSTPELLRGMADAMGKPAHLVPVPAGILKLAANLSGKKLMADRLMGSLQVDISKAEKLLGWRPPICVKEGLKRCFTNRD